MSHRFFSSCPITAEHITLDGPEAHHLLHVMRAAPGEAVIIFDGSGAEFEAVIEKLGRSEVNLRIVDRREINRELPFPLTIGVSLPKGDRQKWLVEKLTELGVTTLVPLTTERSVAQPTGSALERLQRAVIEAAKQCGRNHLMQIAEPQSWSDWINNDCGLRHPEGTRDCGLEKQSAIRNPQSEIRRLIAHPSGKPVADLNLAKPIPTLTAIGPEGGFTDEEVAAATAAGWQNISLGPRTLRIETAAVAIAGAISLLPHSRKEQG